MQTSKGTVSAFRFAVSRAVNDLRNDAIRHKIEASVSTGVRHCEHRVKAREASDKARFLASVLCH